MMAEHEDDLRTATEAEADNQAAEAEVDDEAAEDDGDADTAAE